MIGVAHNRLRFAAGKMSGEQIEKTMCHVEGSQPHP